jgi:hypothetical protein
LDVATRRTLDVIDVAAVRKYASLLDDATKAEFSIVILLDRISGEFDVPDCSNTAINAESEADQPDVTATSNRHVTLRKDILLDMNLVESLSVPHTFPDTVRVACMMVLTNVMSPRSNTVADTASTSASNAAVAVPFSVNRLPVTVIRTFFTVAVLNLKPTAPPTRRQNATLRNERLLFSHVRPATTKGPRSPQSAAA